MFNCPRQIGSCRSCNKDSKDLLAQAIDWRDWREEIRPIGKSGRREYFSEDLYSDFYTIWPSRNAGSLPFHSIHSATIPGMWMGYKGDAPHSFVFNVFINCKSRLSAFIFGFLYIIRQGICNLIRWRMLSSSYGEYSFLLDQLQFRESFTWCDFYRGGCFQRNIFPVMMDISMISSYSFVVVGGAFPHLSTN